MSRAARLVRRLTGSVRVRVTVLATGVFAVALVAASWVLLDVLEQRLVSDVRDSGEATLLAEAGRVGTAAPAAVPADAIAVGDGNTYAFQISSGSPTPIVMVVHGEQPAPGSGAGTGSIDVVVDTQAEAPAGTDDSGASGVAGGSAYLSVAPTDVLYSSPSLFGVTEQQGPFILSTVRMDNGILLSTASSLATVGRTLDATRSILWGVVPLLVLVVAGLSWLLVSRALRPVHLLTSGAAGLSTGPPSGSLSERLPVPSSHDEVAELATTMNAMLDRLERTSTTSRRLVSDAAHELRTPITVMRTELEVAEEAARRDDAPSPDVAAWRGVGERVLGEVDRLQALVDDLLLLARLGERGAAAAPVSMVDLAHDAGARRRRVPVEVDVAAGSDVDEVTGVTDVSGDAQALGRAVDHLVANAARHAESRVELHVETAPGRVVVHVDDDGPGIPDDDREAVLERFVRLDEARSRDAGGSGLGLSVAAEVAAAHGGTLTIDESPLGGARVSLSLPAG